MKNIILLLLAGTVTFLTSCETTKEISLKEDGTGTLVTTNDMSGMIAMAKMSGGAKELEKMGGEVIDTTINLTDKLDDLTELSSEEKSLIKNGKLGINMDMKNEKVITKLHFPFTDPAQVARLDKLSAKIAQGVIKQQMAGAGEAGGMNGMIPGTSIDDYFIMTYSKGIIERKLNKEKYAGVENDEEMKALKQLATMGMGNTKTIYNLPAAVKKSAGKSLSVSDDKKTVTIMTSVEDFFSNATGLEFRIEY
jgi:hypothetical protein